jgi:hypothetical protein
MLIGLMENQPMLYAEQSIRFRESRMATRVIFHTANGNPCSLTIEHNGKKLEFNEVQDTQFYRLIEQATRDLPSKIEYPEDSAGQEVYEFDRIVWRNIR